MYRQIALLLWLTLLLPGCGDGGLIMPSLSDDPDVTLQTVVDGTVLTAEDLIQADLVVGPEGREPDRIQISLVEPGGRVVSESTISAAQMERGRLPAIPLGGLAIGAYTLHFNLYSAGAKTAEFQRRIFVGRSPFRIVGISAYPAAFVPDSEGILRAELDISAGSDPYLRWSFAGRIVSQGLLSGGAGELLLRSPGTEGVYGVRLELFPVEPPGADFEVVSRVIQHSDLVVRAARTPPERGFGPPSSYYALLNFAGNTHDSGRRAALIDEQPAAARPIGDLALRIAHDVFGYYLDGSAGFGFDEVILPLRDRTFEPFSVVMRLVLTEEQSDRVLFAAEAGDSSFGLRMEVAAGGELAARLTAGDRGARLVTSGAGITVGRPVDVALALVPHDDDAGGGTELAWFVDGVPAGAALMRLELPGAPQTGSGWRALDGTSRIAGANGFIGVIDEFGVYFRDDQDQPSANTRPFHTAQAQRRGPALLLAEGFEAARLPRLFTQRGEVGYGGGRAVLSSQAALLTPPLEFRDNALIVEIDASRSPAVPLHWELRAIEDDSRLSSGSASGGTVIRLTIGHRDGVLRVATGDADPVATAVGAALRGVRIAISNGSEAESVSIESLLAYHEPGDAERLISIP